MGKAAEPDILKCEPEQSAGRFVKIEHFSQYITLCEVQVMGKSKCIDRYVGNHSGCQSKAILNKIHDIKTTISLKIYTCNLRLK